MKTRNRHLLLTAASAVLLAPAASAADGTWTNASGGSWNTDTNWSGGPSGIIADGSGFTANFNMDITADATVNLDGARTIGNLIFDDASTATAGSWIVATGTGGPLTLAGTTPTITVNALGTNKNATITATLDGTNGFTKAGSGALVLNNNTNTISGPVVLSAGTLNIQSKPLTNASSLAINAGTLVVATTTGNAIGANNNAKISFGGGTVQYNVDTPSTDYSARFSTDPNQQYRINVISAGTPSLPKVVTFSSDLASAGGTLTKLNTGTLVLAAANTFTGATTVSAGTLELSHAQALQNSAINTAASIAGTTAAGLVLTGVTSPTFGGLIGGKALASLFDTDSGNYGSVTNVTLNPGTGASYSYAAAIADGAAGMTLTKSGDGTQILTVANTYTGGTILSGGTLNYGNASALSSGSISFNGNSTLQAGVATTLANPVSVANSITGTVDTNNFATTLSGALTGNGSLTKTGAGNLTLTGGEANTLAGAININTGRLVSTDGTSFKNMPGTITVASGAGLTFTPPSFSTLPEYYLTNALKLSGSGTSATVGALHIYGNATASGPITLDADTTITHSFNNAYLTGSITGANRNLTLKTTTAGQPGLTISAPISLGNGGITVAAVPVATGETNIVTLSGNNAYSGDTRVQTGTLKLTGSARIPDASAVRIDTGAVLHLDFSGTDTVAVLYLPGDPNPKPNGTYGSLTSTADNKSADFLGDGILQVGGASNNYASWASSQVPPVTGGENGDDDNDGVKNLVEYALVNGGERGVLSGNIITFTKRGAPYGGDLTYIIETSETLSGSWSPAVTHGPAELGSPISYDLAPVPGTPKKFARLKVVKTP